MSDRQRIIAYLEREAVALEAEASRRTVHPDLCGAVKDAFTLLHTEHRTFARAYRSAAQAIRLEMDLAPERGREQAR